MIADIRKGLRYDRVEDSFTWLWKAGVALGVFNTTEPTVPLMLNEKSTLFKLFLQDFRKRDYGFILNTASSAGFFPGPCFSSYYASKAYVVRMTQAVHEELRADHSHVSLSMLCPGPVQTEFMDKARVNFSVPPQSSEYVAEYAVREMFAGTLTIVPSPIMKAGIYLGRAVPDFILAYFARMIQSKRERL